MSRRFDVPPLFYFRRSLTAHVAQISQNQMRPTGMMTTRPKRPQTTTDPTPLAWWVQVEWAKRCRRRWQTPRERLLHFVLR